MFDSKQMLELQYIAADRYQRNGGGGAFKVYKSAKAYHEAHGYAEMSPWRRAVYEATIRWRQACQQSKSDFRWDCHVLTLDHVNGEIPF